MASAHQYVLSFQAISLGELKDSINKELKEKPTDHPIIKRRIHSISHSACFNGNAILYSAIVVFEVV